MNLHLTFIILQNWKPTDESGELGQQGDASLSDDDDDDDDGDDEGEDDENQDDDDADVDCGEDVAVNVQSQLTLAM